MQHFTHRIAFYVAVGDKKKIQKCGQKTLWCSFFFFFFFFYLQAVGLGSRFPEHDGEGGGGGVGPGCQAAAEGLM